MKKILLSAGVYFCFLQAHAQAPSSLYYTYIQRADSFYEAKNYKGAAHCYSNAFKAYNWKGTPVDRYNAACTWALAEVPDSAFFNLFRLAERSGYANLSQLTNDPDFIPLQKDKRWEVVLAKVKANKDKAEENLDKPLVWKLDSIHESDQALRRIMQETAEKHGWQSPQMQELGMQMHKQDEINLVKVKAILDTYGWLGPEKIGEQGNTTLFLVIQHSDQETQEHYLPMMRAAVKDKKAYADHLALVEDRVALGQGKKQIYGSQVGTREDGSFYLLPLEDPDNVDKRRAEVDLPPLAEYLMNWKIVWDVEAYKKSGGK
jgi:hypothetical protein